jgi:hemerythrin
MLQWSKDYQIGIESIDEEHRKIIDEFENLYKRMHDGKGHDYYEHILEFLDKYVEEHFANEEKFQEDIGYPQIDEHKKVHEAFKAKVKKLEETHKGKEVTNSDLIEINLTVKKWLLDHILEEDRKIGEYYSKK